MRNKSLAKRARRLRRLTSAVLTEMKKNPCSEDEAIEEIAKRRNLTIGWKLMLRTAVNDWLKAYRQKNASSHK